MTAAANVERRAPLVAPHRAARRSPAARERAKWTRRGLLAAAAALALFGLAYAFAPKPVPVEIAFATVGPLRVTVDEDGKTKIKDRYLVSAPLVGNVQRIALRPGDVIEKDVVLAQILPLDAPLLDPRAQAGAASRLAAAEAAQRQAAAGVVRATTSLDLAKREAERSRLLGESGSIGPVELERSESELRARGAELASAEFGAKVSQHEAAVAESALGRFRGGRSTEQLEIRSPVAGVVLRVHQESEGAVSPGAPLVEIGDPAHLEVVVDVLTTDAVAIAAGAEATIERWGEERPLSARVRVVEPAAFTKVSALGVEEQRVNVILDLTAPHEAWARLGDGYRVEARIVVWSDPAVLRVSEGALFRHDGGWAVYGVGDGRARSVPVQLGRRNGHDAQIVSGLTSGDAVIVHPSDRVTAGTRIVKRD